MIEKCYLHTGDDDDFSGIDKADGVYSYFRYIVLYFKDFCSALSGIGDNLSKGDSVLFVSGRGTV